MLSTTPTPHAQQTFRLFLLIPLAFLTFLVAAPFLSDFWFSETARNLTGVLAITNRIYDIAFAVSLSLTLLPVGHVICRRVHLRFASSAEELVFSFFVGTGVTGIGILLLGLVGLLRPLPLALLFVVLLVMARKDFRLMHRVIVKGIRVATGRKTRLVALLFLCFLILLLLRTTTPPHVGDELIYHLPATKHFVDAGRVFPNFDNSLANMPFLLHMIYAICVMAGSDIAAKLFSLFVAISTSVALYAFCARFLNRRVGVLSMLAFFAAGMVSEVAVSARIDVSLAGMLFMCTYAMMVFLETRHSGWLWISAAVAGFSLSIKHSAMLWIVFVGVMYLVEQFRKKESAFRIVVNGVLYACIALTIASPWYIKNLVWFHNPFYPFLSGEVADFGPNGPRYFNKQDESAIEQHFQLVRLDDPQLVKELEEELTEAATARPVRHPMRVWEYFTEPSKYLMSEPRHYPNYLFLVIPGIFILPKTRTIWWLLALGIFYVLAVTSSSWIARYLLPAYPVLTVLSAAALTGVVERLGTGWTTRLPFYLTGAALTVIIAFTVVAFRQFESLKFALGTISRDQFEKAIKPLSPIHFLNEEVPSSSRVMCLGMQMNYGLTHKYLADETWFSTKWRRLLIRNRSLEEVNFDLKQNGFEYILYNPGLFVFAARSGLEGTGGMNLMAERDEASASPEHQLLMNWATFMLYRKKFLDPLYVNSYGMEVLKIK